MVEVAASVARVSYRRCCCCQWQLVLIVSVTAGVTGRSCS
jgi:hypothetical protein